MDNIEFMTTNEWLAYRQQKLDEFYLRGNELKPSIGCKTCDTENDYVCFNCELIQMEGL